MSHSMQQVIIFLTTILLWALFGTLPSQVILVYIATCLTTQIVTQCFFVYNLTTKLDSGDWLGR